MDNLQPCECGYTPRPVRKQAGLVYLWHVTCDRCGLTTGDKPNKSMARAAWRKQEVKNDRVD